MSKTKFSQHAEMPTLEADELLLDAQTYNKGWEANEGFDWDEAEHLASSCKRLERSTLKQCPGIIEIVNYADEEDEWDSGYVGDWPNIIERELKSLQ